ncbi:hypothetical protein ROZALSC1DRAFT_21491 [Rozella allomycis CSF55]|uniref:C-type lectin domain-containing protein n=1 Tax=Rozella allomycis (strain CSF55) TaxID=988480 RepID=A0A4P9YLF6_ROZAC|nr:hypothetical protein ROZALSC1DRAFT_21491 [Rozella allomycis CSF55]
MKLSIFLAQTLATLIASKTVLTVTDDAKPTLPKADVVVALSSFNSFQVTIGGEQVKGGPTGNKLALIAHNNADSLDEPFVVSLEAQEAADRQGVAYAVFLKGKLISVSGDGLWISDSSLGADVGNWTTDIDVYLPASWKLVEACDAVSQSGDALRRLQRLANSDVLSYVYPKGCSSESDAAFRYIVDPKLFLDGSNRIKRCSPSRNQVISYFVLPSVQEATARSLCKFYGASLAELWGAVEFDFVNKNQCVSEDKVYISSWNGNDYDEKCIVLNSGKTGALTEVNCNAKYRALCKKILVE